MISDKFVLLGAVFNLIGTAGYARDTLSGKTRPNRVSWLMWSVAPLIAFAAEINQGVGLRSLMTFMAGFCPLIILIASFVNKRSVWKLTKFDFACGVFSVLGLILWALTRHGDVAIAFSILADGLAALPTLRKAYKDPQSESWLAFFTASLSAFITLLTIKQWNFANYGFPLYILLICITLVLLIRFNLGKIISRQLAN